MASEHVLKSTKVYERTLYVRISTTYAVVRATYLPLPYGWDSVAHSDATGFPVRLRDLVRVLTYCHNISAAQTTARILH